MITKVEIKNFQCHKDTTIEFTEGLNVIAGTSASGKSAVRRAILWVITNRPTGTDMISWWIKKGDKIQGEAKVTLYLSDGTVISRVRSSTINEYIINGKELEAVGTGVPREIQEALKMSDINYSTQVDSPFLVSQSASYVSQYLNDIVDLSDADTFQARMETMRRKCNTDIKDAQKQVDSTTKELDSFLWLDKAEALIEKIKALGTSEQEKELDALTHLLDEYDSCTAELAKLDVILSKALPLIRRIEEIPPPNNELEQLTSFIEGYQAALKGLQETEGVDVAERLIRKIERIGEAVRLIEEESRTLQRVITDYKGITDQLVLGDTELVQVELELSQVGWCPYCGSKLQEILHVF